MTFADERNYEPLSRDWEFRGSAAGLGVHSVLKEAGRGGIIGEWRRKEEGDKAAKGKNKFWITKIETRNSIASFGVFKANL